MNEIKDIRKIKKLHCIGIGGIGISAVARFFLAQGVEVSGSDMSLSEELTSLSNQGAHVYFLQSEKNISEGVEVVVYSPAVPEDNVERQEAKKREIPTFSYPEMLGKIMSLYDGIAVSGTNGKTTTTALLGKFLEEGGCDPTVIIGGRVPGWDNNLRLGSSELFVVEGCEYRRSMLNLCPKVIVLTNIEKDHLDYYKDINDIIGAFTEYVLKLKKEDLLVYNMDDRNCRNVALKTSAKKISFGLSNNADIYAQNIINSFNQQSFEIVAFGKNVGKFVTKLPGIFNIYNILAASAVVIDIGMESVSIQRVLDNFGGTWRRFEKVGEIDGSLVFSDYAHHPTAIRGTLLGVRQFFPNKKILVVFQPHHQNRTIKLFDDFALSFLEADEVIVSEIYHVCGREGEGEEDKISSEKLVSAIKKHNPNKEILFAENTKVAERLARERSKDFDIILVMGAGDIDEVARKLVEKK